MVLDAISLQMIIFMLTIVSLIIVIPEHSPVQNMTCYDDMNRLRENLLS